MCHQISITIFEIEIVISKLKLSFQFISKYVLSSMLFLKEPIFKWKLMFQLFLNWKINNCDHLIQPVFAVCMCSSDENWITIGKASISRHYRPASWSEGSRLSRRQIYRERVIFSVFLNSCWTFSSGLSRYSYRVTECRLIVWIWSVCRVFFAFPTNNDEG